MPPANSDRTESDTPASLREPAARARRLAKELTDEAEAKQFIGIAEEIEAKAAALEAHTQADVDNVWVARSMRQPTHDHVTMSKGGIAHPRARHAGNAA
jgi:hypothetical protein